MSGQMEPAQALRHTLRHPRPWRIGLAPPAGRLVEIHYHGANLLGLYLADGDRYQIGADATLPAAEVPRWRELSDEQRQMFQPFSEEPQ